MGGEGGDRKKERRGVEEEIDFMSSILICVDTAGGELFDHIVQKSRVWFYLLLT